MRMRNIKNSDELVKSSPYILKDKFDNNNPIHLEIGMGKGDFIINMALNHPDINFIGIESYTNVMARAVKKMPNDLNNLRLININANSLADIFDHNIEVIYLNFSDPWPKKRHAKKRLTSEDFLNIYDKILKENGKIILKTDSDILFASSIISLNNYGYKFLALSLDIDMLDVDSPKTEYETKFREKGFKIKYLEAVRQK